MQIDLEEIEKQEGSPFVEKFEEFFNSEYRKEIEKILENYPEKRSVVVDFKLLERFDPALADELTDNPDVIIAAAQSAIKNVNIPSLNVDSFEPHIRFSNLPADSELDIRDIGSKHLGKFISIEGVARLITDVLPKIKLAVWKCKRCGNIYKTPQEKQSIKMPNMCECNHRDFELIEDKSDFVDYQKVQIQEPLDKLKGSEQAAHIDVYIMDDLVNKVSGGDKTRFSGVLRLSPPDKEKKSVYRWFLETNYLDETQKEFDEVNVSKEDEEEIRKLAKNPLVYDMLKDSIAPAIYGHDVVKESIGLQLFSGVTKHLPNNQKIRGNIHILLIGDPGCLVGDERVVMGDGAIKKIEDLGESHLQKVDFQILTGEGGKKRDSATTFFYYQQKKVMEIITESGKSIKGTHDHPLLCVSKENGRVKREWKRLDNFRVKDRVAVVTGIPCTITGYVPTGFKKTESRNGPKFKGELPEKVTPELGALLGYMLGDGWVRKKEAYFVVSEPEKDLLPKLEKIVKDLFGIAPGITAKNGPGRKVLLHRAGIHSKDVAHNLLFLREKRVPKIVLESGNKVVAEFLKWLYEADGCVFSKGRGSRSISLKAKNIELLRDVQILLLRFSIHSRIVGNSLMIRRGESIKKFAAKIGFASKKKKEKMNEAAKNAEEHARFKQQRSEKIAKIIDHGLEDVYDIEVPQSHRFIANGIISHNCGKSQLLLAANSIAPKSIYVGGKTTSGVGLCVAPETFVLNDNGFKPIQEFVEENFCGTGMEEIKGCYSNEFNRETYTLGADLKLSKGRISKIWRIKAPEKMVFLKSRLGKELNLTPNTSLIRIKKGKIEWTRAEELDEGDIVACARAIPAENKSPIYSFSAIKGNPNIKIANNISKEFKEITDKLIGNGETGRQNYKKYNNLTELAKGIGKSRETVYNWRTKKFYHGLPLKTFCKLAKEADWGEEKIASCVEKVFISHGKEIRVPKTINNEDIAYLTGIIMGDGSIWRTQKTAGIRLYNNSQEVLDEFDRIIGEQFGVGIQKYVQKGVNVRRISSIIIYSILQEYGLTDKKTKNLLSHSITEQESKILNKTIQGLFDTDGYVAKNSSPHIGLSTISKKLAQTVQLGLLKSGIISKIRERKLAGRVCKGRKITVHSRHNQYAVEIRGENAKKFGEKIGFKVKRKQKALEEILCGKKFNTNIDVVPELGNLINKKGIQWEYRTGKLNPSRKKLLAIGEESKDRQLIALANSDVMWEEIVEKKEFKPDYEYVYDFTVEGTHNFIANGFIAHNTASAVKDDFGEGGWTLKAGALVLSSGGICMADELDKMTPEDRSALHEAMEQGTISVAKAGIVARFKADTSLLAAANPKHHRFDKFQLFTEQIDLPPSLISRFDLFFMIKDILDRDRDKKISDHILMTHQGGEKLRQSEKTGKPLSKKESDYITKLTTPIIDGMLLRKYVSFARQTCFPVLSPEAIEKITDFYISLRDQGRNESRYAATARQLEGLVRLAEASAKVRLSDTVTIEDAERSIRIVRDSLQDTMLDPETGKIDIDIATSGTTHTKQNSWFTVLKIIKDTIGRGEDSAPLEMIIEEAGQKGLTPEKVKETIKELESKGEIYSPRYGLFKPTDPERKK